MLHALVPLVREFDREERCADTRDAVRMREFRGMKCNGKRLIRDRTIGVRLVILTFDQKAKIRLLMRVNRQIVGMVMAHDRQRGSADERAANNCAVKFALLQPLDLAVHGYSITHEAAAVTGRCGERVYSM